jgi:hypothetical protein
MYKEAAYALGYENTLEKLGLDTNTLYRALEGGSEKEGSVVPLQNPYTGEWEQVERPDEIKDSPRWTIPAGLLAGTLGGSILGGRLGGSSLGGNLAGGLIGGVAGGLLGTGAGAKLDEYLHRNDPNREALQGWTRQQYDDRGWE